MQKLRNLVFLIPFLKRGGGSGGNGGLMTHRHLSVN